MKLKKYKKTINLIVFISFLIFSIVSLVTGYDLGTRIWDNFLVFAKDMVLILPPAFALIGLFDVWAKRDKVEKHLGNTNNPMRFIWSILLASTTVGGTFVAFPLANALHHKGAKYSSILTYITASSLFMIPMTIMEASMLGLKFTLIRLLGSLPFIIGGAIVLGHYLEKSQYKLPDILE